MKKYLLFLFLLFTVLLIINPSIANASTNVSYFSEKENSLKVNLLGRYDSGAPIDDGGTEIVAYDPSTHYAYSVNGSEKTLDILQLSNLEEGGNIPLVDKVTLNQLGVSAGDLTSVAIDPNGSYIAVSIPHEDKVENGSVVFLSPEGELLTTVEVGALPDMVAITPDGNIVLVANEGEPNEDYTINPEGSVTMIDVSQGIEKETSLPTKTVTFSDDIIEKNVRKVHPDSTYAEDLEPEYIVVDETSKYAYVVLQESNAIAKLNINTGEFVMVKSLGYKDFSLPKNKLDASDKDEAINIRNWPVLSIYQPDGMDIFELDGKSYILTANEGDAQDWDGFSEEARVEDLVEDYQLNADLYQGYSQEELDQLIENGLFDKEQLGRLKTSISHPKNEDGKFEAIYGYGGRSFSIWDADNLEMVFDSGSDFEEKIAQFQPEYFHSNNDEDTFESRSDDKGIEPESVITGKVNGNHYAFVGLERQGGIMVYDISNPTEPSFESYFTSRKFQGLDAEVTKESGDVAPEGLYFITSEESPTGKPILLAAHEVSGTIAAYELGKSSDSTLSALNIDQEEIYLPFSADQFDYTVEVSNEIEELTFNAKSSSEYASVYINGDETNTVSLTEGDNAVDIEVIAEDGSTSIYTVFVKRLFTTYTDDLTFQDDTWKMETDLSYLEKKSQLILRVPESEKILDTVTFTPDQIESLLELNSDVTIKKENAQITFDLQSFSPDEPLTLSIEPLEADQFTDGDSVLSVIYQLTFEQANQFITRFKTPVTLSFALEKTNQEAQLFYWKEEKKGWKRIGGNVEEDRMVAKTNHFSIFAAFDPKDVTEIPKEIDEPELEREEDGEIMPLPVSSNPDSMEEANTDYLSSSTSAQQKELALPNTATNMYTLMLIGGLLTLIGMVITIVREKRKHSRTTL